MRITILGCGDAFGSGGRLNTTFHLVPTNGARILIDCGATAMVAMRREGIDPDEIDAIVLSHLHGDHFGGIPFLLLYLEYEVRRDRPLTILGPPGTEDRIADAVRVFFGRDRAPWRFPLEVREIGPGRGDEVGGVKIEAFPVVHGMTTSHALRFDDGDRRFAFSGDTTWTDVLLEVGRDVDLFIMECYAFDEECPTHIDWRTLEAQLADIRAKRILLTHMSPSMLARRDEISVGTLEDGMVIDV